MKALTFLILLIPLGMPRIAQAQNGIVVFQSDFGLRDGAVSAMKGVAAGVSTSLRLYDVTHEIPAYNIWEASYRLEQVLTLWPAGTVFVSVVDPGVGTERKSVVAKTGTGHFIVTPDNGTLTHVSLSAGIDSLREIDEAVNRRQSSEQSYTFHGRDVYAFTGARLAAGVITFSETGKELESSVVLLPFQKAGYDGQTLAGTIPVLDVQYGNIWTNIPSSLCKEAGISYGDVLNVEVSHGNKKVYTGRLPLGETFGAFRPKQPLAYFNSLNQLAFAINQGSFAEKYKVGSGNEWKVTVKKSR